MKLILKANLNVAQITILAVLFLGSMNVGNLYFYFVFLAFFACLLFNCRQIKIDGIAATLVMFSLCYLIFYPGARNGLTTILKQFIFPMCYLVGLNFIRPGRFTNERGAMLEYQMSAAIITLPMGAFAHYLLNMVINIDSLSRNTVDIWTGEIITATGQACLAVMATGVFAAILFSNKSKLIKAFAVLGLILVFMYNLVLAGRTLLLLMVLVLCVSFSYTIKTSHNKRKGKVATIFVLIVLSIFVIYVQNLFGVRDWVLGSNLSSRFDRMTFREDTRLAFKYAYAMNFFRYPFGGGRLRGEVGEYAHELYLDVFSDVGIIGYLLVLLFVMNAALKAWIVIKRSKMSRDFKLLVLCVYLAILMEFFLEPIIQGVPWMFCAFCFYSGLLNSIPSTGIRNLRELPNSDFFRPQNCSLKKYKKNI